jgi:hypothetical protein
MNNNISSGWSAIGGGQNSTIGSGSSFATIAGGRFNDIGVDSDYGSIGGGKNNDIADNALYATIPGGDENFATSYAFAAGHRARAKHQGSFVWSDSQDDADTESSLPNQVTFRCGGGVRFRGISVGQILEVAWLPGSPAWSFSSDRNLKEAFQPVDVRAVVEKVCQLPITEWNFKGYTERHIGPMAQDFHAAFPLNDSSTTLNDADLHGVALAAIQGLNQKVQDEVGTLRSELKRRDAENAELRQIVSELKELVNAMNHRLNGAAR